MADERTGARPRVPSWWRTEPRTALRHRRPSRRTVGLLFAIVGGVAAVSLVAVLVVKSHSHTIHGALDVGTIQLDSGCRLAHHYSGISEGTEVVVTDASGVVLGMSTLGRGSTIGPYCEFLFAVKVPDRPMYRIEVDHRGKVTYTKAYLEFYGWNAGLALRGTTLTWI
jgi:hypothetical protein